MVGVGFKNSRSGQMLLKLRAPPEPGRSQLHPPPIVYGRRSARLLKSRLPPGPPGTGNGTVAFVVAPNPVPAPRTSTIQVSGQQDRRRFPEEQKASRIFSFINLQVG